MLGYDLMGSGGSRMMSVISRVSCTLISIKAMITWAQALMKRGFLVQIFFLLPARMRAMRLVLVTRAE